MIFAGLGGELPEALLRKYMSDFVHMHLLNSRTLAKDAQAVLLWRILELHGPVPFQHPFRVSVGAARALNDAVSPKDAFDFLLCGRWCQQPQNISARSRQDSRFAPILGETASLTGQSRVNPGSRYRGVRSTLRAVGGPRRDESGPKSPADHKT